MTEQQINAKLDALDKMIAEETNASTLATLSRCYQKLIDKLVEMDRRHEHADRR